MFILLAIPCKNKISDSVKKRFVSSESRENLEDKTSIRNKKCQNDKQKNNNQPSRATTTTCKYFFLSI